MDVITINCLECILLNSISYLVNAKNYGIKCKVDYYTQVMKKSYNYLLISRLDCIIIDNSDLSKFIRINCEKCK